MKYAYIFLVLFLTACVHDNARIHRHGRPLYPQTLPLIITTHLPGNMLDKAMAFWNDSFNRILFISGLYGTVTVKITDAYNLGTADIVYSRTGEILQCDITLSNIYNDDVLLEALKHELGHCLGLEDDPPSVDLNSIMSDPLPYRGQITERDREVILGNL